jgi:hypothetical protein
LNYAFGADSGQKRQTYYAVSMDKDASDDPTLFLADEIEAEK